MKKFYFLFSFLLILLLAGIASATPVLTSSNTSGDYDYTATKSVTLDLHSGNHVFAWITAAGTASSMYIDDTMGLTWHEAGHLYNNPNSFWYWAEVPANGTDNITSHTIDGSYHSIKVVEYSGIGNYPVDVCVMSTVSGGNLPTFSTKNDHDLILSGFHNPTGSGAHPGAGYLFIDGSTNYNGWRPLIYNISNTKLTSTTAPLTDNSSVGAEYILAINTLEGTYAESNFFMNVSAGVLNSNISFTDASIGNITSWYWNFGDGNTSTEQNPTHVFSTSGVYNVSLEVNNNTSLVSNQTVRIFGTDVIVFETTGSTFSPIITVTGTPTVNWTFGDGTTSSSTTPSINYHTSATRYASLNITPWDAVTKINLGYYQIDGGNATIADTLTSQHVSAIYNLNNVKTSLQVFACENENEYGTENSIQILNFDNFTQLEYIETGFLTSLNTVSLKNLTHIKRICFERCGLSYADFTDCPTLEDFRGAYQHGVSKVQYVFDAPSYPSLWHLCIVLNGDRIYNNIDWQKFTAVRQLWLYDDTNLTGDLNPSSTILDGLSVYNSRFTSANLYGTLPYSNHTGTQDLNGCNLSHVNVFGNPGLNTLYVSNNKLNRTEVDNVLYALDITGTTGGTVSVQTNTYPSRTGMIYHDNLISKGWTVNHDEPPNIPADPNTTTPNASFTKHVLDSTHNIVAFNDSSTNATAWQWNFGDGSANSTLQNPTHIYGDSGLYTVTLTVSNAVGSSSVNDSTNTNLATYKGNYTESQTNLTGNISLAHNFVPSKINSITLNIANPCLDITNETFGSGSGLTGWNYYKNITVDHTKVSSTLSNYPFFINVTNDTNIGSHALSTGYDLRFTDSNGNLLNYERENFTIVNGVCNASIWVNIPSLSNTTDTVIIMYYGNNSATDGQNITGVWDSNYLGVWHMNQNPGAPAPQITDSTRYNNDGTKYNLASGDLVDGIIGKGISFSSSTEDYIDAGTSSNLSVSTSLSIEAIIKPSSISGYPVIAARWAGTNRAYKLVDSFGGNGYPYSDVTGTGTGDNYRESSKSIDTTKYHQVSFTYNGSGILNNYIDGKLSNNGLTGLVPTSLYSTTQNLFIGSDIAGGNHFNGIIDEVRISNITRSEDWIYTVYNNTIYSSTFYTISSESSSSASNTTYQSLNPFSWNGKTIGTFSSVWDVGYTFKTNSNLNVTNWNNTSTGNISILYNSYDSTVSGLVASKGIGYININGTYLSHSDLMYSPVVKINYTELTDQINENSSSGAYILNISFIPDRNFSSGGELKYTATDATFINAVPSGNPSIESSDSGATVSYNSSTKIFSIAAGALTGDTQYTYNITQVYDSNSPPDADFSANVTSGTSPKTIQFTDSSTGSPTSLTWSFGDGTANSTEQNPTHVYGAGTFTVSLTASNANGSDTETKTGYITVSKSGTTVSWSNPTNITYPIPLSSTQLNAAGSVAGSIVYNPISGTVLSAGTHTLNCTFTPTDSDNYSSSTGSVTINVSKANPSITWSNPSSITYGTALSGTQLNANSATAGTFAYTPSSGTILAVGSQTLNTTLTPTDSTNYSSASASVTMTVNKATPVITWSDPANITEGTALSSTQLNAVADVAGSFVYDPTSGTVLEVGTHTLNTTFTPTDSTNYTTATDNVSITVTSNTSNAPVAAFSANTTSGTEPLTVAFTDSSTNTPTSWLWNFGDGYTAVTQNPTHTFLTAGTYTVSLRATNAYGSDYENKTAYITVAEAPIVPVAAFSGTPRTGTNYANVTFTDSSSGSPTSWAWSFGDGTSNSTSQNPVHNFTSIGTYTVTLTATNANGSDSEVKSGYITVSGPGTISLSDYSGSNFTVYPTRLYVGQHDIVTLTDRVYYNSAAFNLSGITIYYVYTNDLQTVSQNITCTGSTTGKISIPMNYTNSGTAGTYFGQYILTDGETRLTIPASGYVVMKVNSAI